MRPKKGKNVLTDYFIERGDYVKLDMVTLSYTFQTITNGWTVPASTSPERILPPLQVSMV